MQKEIEDSKTWYNRVKEKYLQEDLKKRIELKLGARKYENPDFFICTTIESRINKIIDKINRKDSLIESDLLDSGQWTKDSGLDFISGL